MVNTTLLEFENAQVVQSLFAQEEELLRKLEEKLPVKIITRDGWIKIEGEETPRTTVATFLEHLAMELDQGQEIFPQYFLQEFEKHHEKSLLEKQTTTRSSKKIYCSPRKPPVQAKTEAQIAYLEAMDHHAITFGIGPAGTGKTYLAIAKAIEALKEDRVTNIILTRPAVEAGEALGFLPGQLQEKLFPYLRPLYDALNSMMEQEEVERLTDKNIIQIAPLAYMRGRTLSRSFIILDEAQNTTREQMFMFLTRIGMGSQAVITGDPSQVDLPKNKPSGLREAIKVLSSISKIAFYRFKQSDVVRHPLVREIIRAYQEERYEHAG